ncbi:MAG: hypothetical protein AB8B87_14215 [Granulosicoccus sp.]
MQSVPNKAKFDDSEDAFEFLNLDEEKPVSEPLDPVERDVTVRRKPQSVPQPGKPASGEKPFPVIRKPVCVSQTGTLRPPRPGDPVEPPPPLTEGIRPAHAPIQRPDRAKVDLSDLDDLHLDLGNDDWPLSDQWVDEAKRSQSIQYDENRASPFRVLGYLVAALLIVAGIGAAVYSNPAARQWSDELVKTFTGGSEKPVDNELAGVTETPAVEETPVVENEPAAVLADAVNPVQPATTPVPVNTPKSLNTLFREELASLEVLLEQDRLDEAEAVLQNMDRAVYGYGAPEFSDIKERIAAQRPADTATQEAQVAALEAQRLEQERALEEQRQAEEALQREAEQQRIVAEAERQAEQQRLAAEAERQAQVQREAEQQRVAAEAALQAQTVAQPQVDQQRAVSDAEQLALQRAQLEREAAAQAQLRSDRIAQEQARQELLEIARAERDQLEQQASSAQQPSIQDIAASQREAARQQRLLDAQGGSTPAIAPVPAPVQSDIAVARVDTPVITPTEPVQAVTPRAITDADLQLVYGQFTRLESAIENRDINAVIGLTERSGLRIQQVMQMFENNVSIQARLRNVSTLDSSGEIQGTLQITRLERADGSVTGPPLDLASVRLSSVRNGDSWSSIRW